MEGSYKNKEFEQFLKENANQHRLYPSEKVWESIHARLHNKRRWTALALFLLFLSISSVSVVMFSPETPSNKKLTVINKNIDSKKTKNPKPSILISKEFRNSSLEKSPLFASDAEKLSNDNISSFTSDDESTIVENNSLAVIEEKSKSQIAIEHLAVGDVISKASVSPKEKLSITANTQEPVIAKTKKGKGFNWQVHLTPTITYRKLKEDSKFIESARTSMAMTVPYFATNSDIKNVVKHRPDMGIQFGVTGRAALSKRLFFTTGLQFNVSKYDIKAYSYPNEVATIAYSNTYGYPSSISTVTNYRINGGLNKANWLRNYYFSAAVPIGLEWRIAGTRNNYWGISGTVQPTYVLGDRAYVISTNYQNYAEVPYLTRKWNLNFGIETFAKVKIGNANLRVGPQFRYQAFSSFIKEYPVQEHLFDFGVKMGLILGK
jgi:hypothetical protein